MRHPTGVQSRLLALLAAGLLAVTACGDGGGGAGGDAGGGSLDQFDLADASFTVGSKEFTEQLILGEIAAQALQATGADVTGPTSIQGTTNVRTALTSGEIDMYWEYTGTGWITHLGQEAADAPRGAEELYDAVSAADLEQNQITWLAPAPLDNAYAIATAQGRDQELGVSTLSDYARLANENPGEATLCGAAEFLTRDDGLPGLEQAYGFDLPNDAVAEVDLGVIYTQIPSGDVCNFGEVFLTDGRISANDLVVVEDDQGFFVNYNVSMTGRQEVFDQNPQLAEVFAPISAALTTELMRGLNERVDVEGEMPEDVAEDFLRENGFLG
jgi:osmoprotectant transport system substrate-binding protein